MIRYALLCEAGHEFESWFSNSSGFEEQAKRGFVSCPDCGSVRVERAIMAPNVARTDRGPRLIEATAEPATAPAPAGPSAPAQAGAAASAGSDDAAAPVVLMGEKEIAIRQLLTAIHAQIVEKAENVGKSFADEALKIHHGESESRPIYGEASPDDARMLEEEGVEFMALPRLPGARN
jgi:hypothetical protein